MAGDRHGKHNTTTISFRVNSYEKATIEEAGKKVLVIDNDPQGSMRTIHFK